MASFLGTYSPRLDEKGRLILPAKFRERLAPGLVLARGHERCIFVFPADVFESLIGDRQGAPLTNKEARDYLRMLLSGASDEIPDKQGRVTIPAHLRQYAGLDRDLTVVGVGTQVEIWEPGRWDDFYSAAETAYVEQSKEVVPGLL